MMSMLQEDYVCGNCLFFVVNTPGGGAGECRFHPASERAATTSALKWCGQGQWFNEDQMMYDAYGDWIYRGRDEEDCEECHA